MLYFLKKIYIKFKSQLYKIQCRNNKYTPKQEPPLSGMDKETIIKKISQIPYWWHSIELGHGIVTPGDQGSLEYPTSGKNLFANLKVADNLKGKSVLDIGAWDGYFSFTAEENGASKVLAIDNFYRDQLEFTETQGFEIAKEILKSKVEFKKASVYDLCPEKFGMFDIIFFFGVFYHLKHPMMALEQIYSVTKEMLVMETHYEPYYSKDSQPVARFYGGIEVNQDPTTWWGLSESCIINILKAVGFKKVEVVYRYADRIGVKAYK